MQLNAKENDEATPAISVCGLGFSYRDQVVFDGVSFEVKPGDMVAVLGPNGIGKTTLFYLLLDILKPKAGKILIDGHEARNDKKFIRNTIGFVFQDPNDQLFTPSVWEDIAFGPHNQGKTREEVEEIVDKVLDILEIQHLRDKKPNEMSHGQRKLVSIATILALDPKIIIMDEPLAGLDGRSRARVQSIMRRLNRELQKTILFSTHDALVASEMANTVLVIESSKNIIVGGRDDVLRDLPLLDRLGVNTNPISRVFQEFFERTGNPSLLDGKVPITVEEGVDALEKIARTGNKPEWANDPARMPGRQKGKNEPGEYQ